MHWQSVSSQTKCLRPRQQPENQRCIRSSWPRNDTSGLVLCTASHVKCLFLYLVGRMLVMISQDVLDWTDYTQHQRRVKRHDTMQIGELLENYLPRSPQQFKRRLHNSVREGSDVHQTRGASGRDVIRAVPIVIAVAVAVTVVRVYFAPQSCMSRRCVPEISSSNCDRDVPANAVDSLYKLLCKQLIPQNADGDWYPVAAMLAIAQWQCYR
jgi:hypothetical protein